MSTTLTIIDQKDSSLTLEECAQLETEIGKLINAHKKNRQEINRLTFECVAAMTAGDDHEQQLSSKTGLRRLLGGITGSNKRLQDKINSSRAAAQYASQQTLQRLAEENLMTFDLITAVNNRLSAMILATEGAVNELYMGLIRFFKQSRSDLVQLSNRVDKLEQNLNLVNWQNTIEYQMFNGVEYRELDNASKLVCLTRDFYDITRGQWTTAELLHLKVAMDTIGTPTDGKTNLIGFLKTVVQTPALEEKLLGGKRIRELPEGYLIPLLGIKKLQNCSETGEDSDTISVISETLAENGVNVTRQSVVDKYVLKFMQKESGIDADIEINNFDLLQELLFNLKQGDNGCLVAEAALPAKGPKEDPKLPEGQAEAEAAPAEVLGDQWIDLTEEQADFFYTNAMKMSKSECLIPIETERYCVFSNYKTFLIGNKATNDLVKVARGMSGNILVDRSRPDTVYYYDRGSNGATNVYRLDLAGGSSNLIYRNKQSVEIRAVWQNYLVYATPRLVSVPWLGAMKAAPAKKSSHGDTRDAQIFIYDMDKKTETELPLPKDTSKYNGDCVAVAGGKLYAFAGKPGWLSADILNVFDLKTMKSLKTISRGTLGDAKAMEIVGSRLYVHIAGNDSSLTYRTELNRVGTDQFHPAGASLKRCTSSWIKCNGIDAGRGWLLSLIRPQGCNDNHACSIYGINTRTGKGRELVSGTAYFPDNPIWPPHVFRLGDWVYYQDSREGCTVRLDLNDPKARARLE